MHMTSTGIRALLCLAVTLWLPEHLLAQEVAVAGTWNGVWIAPEGFVYAAEMHLTVDANNTVEGYITWTLRQSPRPAEQSKIGLTGLEFVRGTYDSRCRVARLVGYRLDDPAGILGLDRYELLLARTGASLGGITWHHGPWTGQLLLTR